MSTFWERKWSKVKDSERDFTNLNSKWPTLSRYIPKKEGIIIVDLGCGDGIVSKEILNINPNARYIGLDVSEVALGIASNRLPGVEFYKINSDGKLPLENDLADFVFTSEVIEHVYDTEYAFSEMARILKPGGRLLLTTPYHGFFKNLLIVLLGFDRHFDPTGITIRYFSKKSLFSCLRKVSLKILSYSYFGRFRPFPMSIIVLAEKSRRNMKSLPPKIKAL
jgi:ubiquinone/menaquinone biosynthesis C-methylase UbiE